MQILLVFTSNDPTGKPELKKPNKKKKERIYLEFFFPLFHECKRWPSDWISIKMRATNPVTLCSLCTFSAGFYFLHAAAVEIIITFCESIILHFFFSVLLFWLNNVFLHTRVRTTHIYFYLVIYKPNVVAAVTAFGACDRCHNCKTTANVN